MLYRSRRTAASVELSKTPHRYQLLTTPTHQTNSPAPAGAACAPRTSTTCSRRQEGAVLVLHRQLQQLPLLARQPVKVLLALKEAQRDVTRRLLVVCVGCLCLCLCLGRGPGAGRVSVAAAAAAGLQPLAVSLLHLLAHTLPHTIHIHTLPHTTQTPDKQTPYTLHPSTQCTALYLQQGLTACVDAGCKGARAVLRPGAGATCWCAVGRRQVVRTPVQRQ